MLQVVWFAIGLQSLCSIFLCVAAASNVSSESWHPLALVIIVVLIGSTAHGTLSTCKQLTAFDLFRLCLQCASPECFLLVCRIFPHSRLRGIFVLWGLEISLRTIALVRPSHLLINARTCFFTQKFKFF